MPYDHPALHLWADAMSAIYTGPVIDQPWKGLGEVLLGADHWDYVGIRPCEWADPSVPEHVLLLTWELPSGSQYTLCVDVYACRYSEAIVRQRIARAVRRAANRVFGS